jgi:hypothetical protein
VDADRAQRASSPADPFDAGPYTRLQAALHLPPASPSGACRRALGAAVLAWVPLVVLAAFQGLALGDEPRMAFLLDISAHARYLVALPILIAAEPWCLPRLSAISRVFGLAGLVVGEDRARLVGHVASARRLLDHRGVEIGLAAVAFIGTVGLGGIHYPRDVGSWVAPGADGASTALSLAGWWRTFISQPLFVLAVGAWVWRVLVWARFLWGVSRLELRLVPSHPDLSGGLRFLAGSVPAFAPVSLAVGCVVAGTIAEQVIFAHAPVRSIPHPALIAATVLACIFIFVGPLAAFAGPLRRARLRGIMDYGALASGMGRRFEERWIRDPRRLDPEILSAPDFSATTDLYSIAANVHRTAVLPVGAREVAMLGIATLVPFLPLVFLVIPPAQVLKGFVDLFF